MPNPRLQARDRDQVDLRAQNATKFRLQPPKGEQSHSVWYVDQQIDIAVRSVLTARCASEQAQHSHPRFCCGIMNLIGVIPDTSR